MRKQFERPYRQLIKENRGVSPGEFLPGYSEKDGSRFDSKDIIHQMMEVMARYLRTFYGDFREGRRPMYILDVGSGSGSLSYFLRQTIPEAKIFTLDGNRGTEKSPFIDKETHFVVRTDQDYTLVDKNGDIIKFDLIVSFEHLEHIQDAHMRVFLENIHKHAHAHTLFIGTAAMWEYEAEEEKHIHCNVKGPLGWGGYLRENTDLIKACLIFDLPELLDKTRQILNSPRPVPPGKRTSGLSVLQIVEQLGEYSPLEQHIVVNLLETFILGRKEEDHDQTAWAHRFLGSLLIVICFNQSKTKEAS